MSSTTTVASVRIVALGAALGIVATALTYRHALGLGFTLYGIALLGSLIVIARIQKVQPVYRNLFLFVPAVFFVVMLAVRSEEMLTFLNLSAATGAALLLIYFFSSGNAAQQNIVAYPFVAMFSGIAVFFQPFSEAAQTAKWFSTHKSGWHGVLPFVRGAVITVPVVGVFVVLLSAADEVFARAVKSIFDTLLPTNLSDIAWQSMFALFFAWIAVGGMSFALLDRKAKRSPTPPRTPPPEAAKTSTSQATGEASTASGSNGESSNPKEAVPELTVDDLVGTVRPAPILGLGFTESVMLLGSVCAVFAGFVVIQFVYLFGGERNIANFSYAEYVHRGFTELVLVAILTLALALILNTVAVRKTRRNYNIIRGLNTFLILLTGIILVSAFQRLRLYELTYGLTTLRLMIYVFIAWLGVLFAGFMLSLYWIPPRINVFSLTALIAVFGFVATLDILNPNAFVAWQSVNRGDIDPLYLATLSEEAVPMLVSLVDAPEPGTREIIRETLLSRRNRLNWYSKGDWRDFSLGRSTTLAALETVKDKLGTFNREKIRGTGHTLDEFTGFLRKGMTTRQIARQFGFPYYSSNYDSRYGDGFASESSTLALVYGIENTQYLRLRIHTATGLEDVSICTQYWSGSDCQAVPLSK